MLPHDWSVELPFSRTYSSGTGYLAGGIGWYRGRFWLPEAFRGKKIRLVFDGVYKTVRYSATAIIWGRGPAVIPPFPMISVSLSLLARLKTR